MKKVVLTLLSMMVLVTVLLAQSSTIILNPSQQASFADNYPTTVFTNYEDFIANAWTNGGPLIQRSMMQFDFSSIPECGIIDSAYLSLYGHASGANPQSSSTLSGSNASVLQRVTSPWNESTVTWNTQPTTTTLNSVSLPMSTSNFENYLNIDITQLVIDMINFGNNGFMISLDTEQYYRCLLFASMHTTDTSLYPRLRISYTCYTDVPNSSSNANNDINKIYPNPASTTITIHQSTIQPNQLITITDVLGNKVFSQLLNNSTESTIDISNLSNGIYFYEMNGQRGKIVKN